MMTYEHRADFYLSMCYIFTICVDPTIVDRVQNEPKERPHTHKEKIKRSILDGCVKWCDIMINVDDHVHRRLSFSCSYSSVCYAGERAWFVTRCVLQPNSTPFPDTIPIAFPITEKKKNTSHLVTHCIQRGRQPTRSLEREWWNFLRRFFFKQDTTVPFH